MTFEEYNKEMAILEENYQKATNEEERERAMDELNTFQWIHMREFVANYKAKAKGNKAKEKIAELFEYAVENSQTGSAVLYVESEELKDEIDEIIWEEIGEYMLDAPQYYQTDDGEWAIDCMFGGNYVPEWDGWDE